MGGLFTLVLVFVINALLRGAGEARRAMQVLILATVVTVISEPVLVLGWGPFPRLGVAGSAASYVLGFGAGVAYQLWILLTGRARIGIRPQQLRPDLPLMWHIVKIALPSTIQMTLRSSSRLAIMALVGVYGTFATAGYGLANRMLLIALIPCFGLGNAGSTLVGQNMGAAKPQRAERAAWTVSGYALAYMIAVTTLLFIFAKPLVALFDPTPEVVRIGTQCIRIVAFSMVGNAVGIVLARGFDGAGNTVPAAAINLLSLWLLEVPVAFLLSSALGLGLVGIWWGRAAANIANGVLFAFWFRRGKWKERQV
jgi:putative MATE family efflux protein